MQANAGLFSSESAQHPSTIPGKILMPWRIPSRTGTIAADTSYYPFGTRMYIPGYGWGIVGDRGSAIKGPDHIDIFVNRHSQTLNWGKRKVMVDIYPPQ